MLRESGNILDIATVISSRSFCAPGFVNQHRVLSLMKALCRTANSCKAGLVVGALRIACNGLCTAARFHTAEENPGSLLGCHEGLDCLRHYNRCPTLLDHIRSLWPGASECISPTAIFNDVLFKIAVRSDRLCILVSGLLDAFVTAFDLRRTYGPWSQFQRIYVWQNQDDDRPVSGVGPHQPDDVLGVEPGTADTRSLPITQAPESQNQWLIMIHGSINVVPASIGLKTTDQTWHYEQWLHLKFAARNRRRDASPAVSKSRQKIVLHTNKRTTSGGHLLALIAHSSCLRCPVICVDRTVQLPNQPLWICSAPFLSSYGDVAGCSSPL